MYEGMKVKATKDITDPFSLTGAVVAEGTSGKVIRANKNILGWNISVLFEGLPYALSTRAGEIEPVYP